MNAELEVLWKLRELDEQRTRLQATLARYPEQRAALDHRVTAEKARLEVAKAKAADLQKRRRERERDIEAAIVEERKFQSQLPAVKKNEEYQALLKEIAGAKAKRSDIETQVLVLFEEEEKAQAERPPIEQALAAAERELADRRGVIDAEETSERTRLVAVDAERSALIAQLTPSTRTRYERTLVSLAGRAVVPIVKGACGGCFRSQAPQVLQEARKGDRLLACDGCGRLMILPPGGA